MESVVQMRTDFNFSAFESELYFEIVFSLNIICMLKVHSIGNETVVRTSHTPYITEGVDICFLKQRKVGPSPVFQFLKIRVCLPYLVSSGSMIYVLFIVKYCLIGFHKMKLVFGNAYHEIL